MRRHQAAVQAQRIQQQIHHAVVTRVRKLIRPRGANIATMFVHYYAPIQGALSDDARLMSVCRVHWA